MQTQARLEAFGVEPAEVTLEVTRRSPGWRLGRAIGFGLPGLLLLGLSILPPHALWALSGLLMVTFAIRKYLERFTLEQLTGRCPHCDADVSQNDASRLKARSSLTCDACQRSSELVVDMDALEASTRA